MMEIFGDFKMGLVDLQTICGVRRVLSREIVHVLRLLL